MSLKHLHSISASPRASRQGDQFQSDLVALIPHLRAFSRTLCGKRDFAEDLAQEALMKAWRARDSYQSGTNLKAWLFTILRNSFYSHGRRAWRETHFEVDAAERIEAPANEQGWAIELSDTARALHRLPEAQRDAVILVGAGGFSYNEAAKICDTNTGTMKSRVARGRMALIDILDGKMLPPRSDAERDTNGSEDILLKLTALATVAGHQTATHA